MKPNRERFFVFSLLVILTHFYCKLNPFSGELLTAIQSQRGLFSIHVVHRVTHPQTFQDTGPLDLWFPTKLFTVCCRLSWCRLLPTIYLKGERKKSKSYKFGFVGNRERKV